MNRVKSTRNLRVVKRQFIDWTTDRKEKKSIRWHSFVFFTYFTYKSLDFDVSFCLEMTTAPSSLRLADSATTDISPTLWPRRFVTEIKTFGFLALTDDELMRLTTTGTAFWNRIRLERELIFSDWTLPYCQTFVLKLSSNNRHYAMWQHVVWSKSNWQIWSTV